MLAVAGVNTAGTEEILATHWGKITLSGVAFLLVLLAPQRGALGRGALGRGALRRGALRRGALKRGAFRRGALRRGVLRLVRKGVLRRGALRRVFLEEVFFISLNLNSCHSLRQDQLNL